LPKLVPLSQKTANLCSSQAGGKEVKAVCSVGCIACKMCVKKCPVEAVSMDGKLAVVDGNKCTGHGVCIEKCPTGSMRFLHEPAEAAEVPAEEPEQESASASAE
jgi:ferredoxin